VGLGHGETAHIQAVIGMQVAEADRIDVVQAGVLLQGPERPVPKIKY
jgi:hypothetical protein